MKVGIDFGTTYTKVAYVDERSELKLFRFPSPRGQEYIPTAVSYRHRGEGESVAVGQGALNEASNFRNVELIQGFKMFLPAEDPNVYGWTGSRPPTQVARDYLERLLREGRYSFQKVHGEITGAVVSVPEIWQRMGTNPGAEVLWRVVVDEMGLPVKQLASEPVCAAAYFFYQYQRGRRSLEDFHLLVCDVGGGTFDVALCRIHGQQIEVVDFDGNSEEGLGLAGRCFDYNAVRLAYSARHPGEVPAPNALDTLLAAFEEQKINPPEDVAALIEGLADPIDPAVEETLKEVPLYSFTANNEQYTLKLGQVRESFERVAQGIREVLERLQHRARGRGISIERIAIVGGFGQFPLVQRAILDCLGIRDPNDPRFDRTLHRDLGQFYAIAYGAALIAAGRIQPVEYYPHSLLIETHCLGQDRRIQSERLPIIEAGKAPAGSPHPVFATLGGQRVPIRVEPSRGYRLPLFIRLNGTGDLLRLEVPPVDLPDRGEYYLGVKIDRSNMGILVLQPVDGRRGREYRLGNINPVLIARRGDRHG